MRTPKIDAITTLALKERDFITQTRTYKLITPLFGGGVVPGEMDPVTPIRGTEIRGHLRFWWRATRSGQLKGSLKKMKESEDKLWGAAANTAKKTGPSQVQIAIEIISHGQADSPFEVVSNKRGRPQVRPRKESIVPAYAAFPLQPAQKEAKIGMKTKSVQVGIRFQLTISYPKDMRDEVEAAIWAWETFGGIGARTRRGFGALQCTKINGDVLAAPNSSQLEKQIKAKLEKHVVSGKRPKDIPYLPREAARYKLTNKQKDISAAWNFLINRLRGFRQDRRGSKYGPSLWPEPNAIRSLAKKPTKGTSSPIEKFPRAQFGLPIIFHFPQDRNLEDANLTGAGDIERFSSPLILRPLACADGAVGLALILAGPVESPDGLELQMQDQKKPFPVQAKLDPVEAKKIEPLQGQTDVLQAFLDTL